MLLYAIIAALAVVVAVAVGVLTVATGGMGLIALGAIAGLVGGGVGAIVGGLACGQLMAPGREWNDSKSDFKIQGTKAITGGHTITCKAGGTIQYAPNIKSWLGAIGYASLSYGSELVKCAFTGAGIVGLAPLVVGSTSAGMIGGGGFTLARASAQFAWPTLSSIGSNILTSFGIRTGSAWLGASILGARGIFGAESAAKTYAIDEVDENGNPVSIGDQFLKGALPEYELGSRLHEKGLSGLQLSDAMFLLYFLNVKSDPPGTFRDRNGKLRNAKNNPREQKTGSLAKDPRKTSSGGKGKAYESNSKLNLKNKPKNSPKPKEWIKKGGKVEVLEDGTWKYTDWEGNVVNYKNGHPDFSNYSRQKVDIGKQKGDHYHDYKNAEKMSKEIPPKKPNDETTWHHHEDGKHMMEVNKKIHDRFTHSGGVSNVKKAKLGKK